MKTRHKIGVLAFAASAVGQGLYAQAAPASEPQEEDVIELSPFEVSSTRDTGYQATETLAGTRIRTDLRDVGGAITVITKEFLQDIGATDSGTLLQYTPNAEVAGDRGNFAGLGDGSSIDEGSNLRSPSGAQRVRGLTAADNTRDYFVTDIPWDGFNVDRIDIARGPNSFLFGLGSPAGIVNASLRNAEFRNVGSVQTRVGSYGSVRGSLDVNQVLLDQTLAIRFAGLWDEQKFRQEPAFEDDKRLYGTIRFEPRIFKDRTWLTSFKVKYEHGEIDANRPRQITPNDSISPWYRPKAADFNSWTMENGMGKVSVDNGYDANRSNIQEILDGNALGWNKGLQVRNAANPNYQPWLSTMGINQQQPFWLQDGGTGQTFEARAGYNNPGARNANGTTRNLADGLAGKRYSDQFFGLTNMPTFAANAQIPLAGSGQYRTASLQDPSIFNFYENLIDGPNKWEKEEWDALNLDFSQTLFDGRLGVQASYDKQDYARSSEAKIGTAPTISIDILKNHLDYWRLNNANGLTVTNPNYGRAYVNVNSGGTGNSYTSTREFVRGSIFGELRANDFFDEGSFLAKLLGKHRVNGIYSNEEFQNETRGWNRLALPLDWAAYWTGNTGTGEAMFSRPVTQIIYLGGKIDGLSSASGANIPRIMNDLDVPDGNVSTFNSTWQAFNVPFGDPWTVPANLSRIWDPAVAHTQNENPANYVGWSNYPMTLLRYDNGADQSLTTSAAKALRETTSYAGSWQAYLWNDAIVATFGWRYDEVKGKDVTSQPTLPRSVRNLDPSVYRLPDEFPANQTLKGHSTAGSAVVHLNRLFGDRDPLPINVSLSYAKSDNFQVAGTRRDVYGKVLGNPTGETKDFGVILATKDNRYSLRVVKYETNVQNASSQFGAGAIGGFVAAGLTWRNVHLYKLGGYDWSTREQPRSRNYWGGPANSLETLPRAQTGGSPADTSITFEEGRARENAAIQGWNEIQAYALEKGFLDAWGLTNLVPLSVLTDRTTYENAKPDGPTGLDPAAQYMPTDVTSSFNQLRSYSASQPQGLTVTQDAGAEGYEFEFTANPTPNWRVAFNASETTAVRTNVGGESFKDMMAFLDSKVFNSDGSVSYVGQMPQFGNLGLSVYLNNYAQFRGNYEQLKLQEGTAAPEIRKWRYQLMTNYTFSEGKLKGFGIGANYRWADKVVIGYPVRQVGAAFEFDLSQPYHGPTESSFDPWISYERKLTNRINWRIQLNVYNLGQGDELIPISVQPDGKTWASVRIAPSESWYLTNTFSF